MRLRPVLLEIHAKNKKYQHKNQKEGESMKVLLLGSIGVLAEISVKPIIKPFISMV